ncbi:MAG: hypothetical protein JO090_01810 [Rhizobacter sp.]|nr:hypothetical protein [Rhizobacter sp.]
MRLLLAFVLSIVLLDARGTEVGDACLADLDALPGFLLANDAGGRDLAAQRGAALDEALEHTRVRAREAVNDGAWADALRAYLRV